ncbi:MAG: hypothetical protein AB1512_03045 [Thermodesulfobacteriota bacterium]
MVDIVFIEHYIVYRTVMVYIAKQDISHERLKNQEKSDRSGMRQPKLQ